MLVAPFGWGLADRSPTACTYFTLETSPIPIPGIAPSFCCPREARRSGPGTSTAGSGDGLVKVPDKRNARLEEKNARQAARLQHFRDAVCQRNSARWLGCRRPARASFDSDELSQSDRFCGSRVRSAPVRPAAGPAAKPAKQLIH